MKYKLINDINPLYNTVEQVLTNRGIERYDIQNWLHTMDSDINDFRLLGEDKLLAAAKALLKVVANDKKALVVVDSDADGYTSSALLINYLHDIFPAWVRNHLDWFIHSGKQHGLSDLDVETTTKKYSLLLLPDSSSNDYEYHLAFTQRNVDIVVLDHHEAEITSPNAIVINNQLCDYPNKNLSGAGITWQFCRYLDSLLNMKCADKYIDLVALGNLSDMMSLRSIETKHLIFKGFRSENIRNPFFSAIVAKNSYLLGDKVTPHGAAWFITPYINAMVRSGTQEEKELLFNAFLNFRAYDYILSTKRGHKLGETEQLVDQAVRTCTNVKKRQTDAQDAAMTYFKKQIEDNNMLDHKVLLFTIEPGVVDKNIAGLCANKIMGEYQRPCAILTKVRRTLETPDGDLIYTTYEGSARGCDRIGLTDFKSVCEATELTEFSSGHPGAFGLGIGADNIESFVETTDDLLADMESEAFHYVDYIFTNTDIDYETILSIGQMGDLWGQNVEQPKVAIDKLRITPDMVTVYAKKTNTVRITIPNNKTTLILFDAPEDLCQQLQNTQGYVIMNIVGEPALNEYNGFVSAQIKVKEYEVVGESRYSF